MNATLTINIDDEAQTEYDREFTGLKGFSTFEEMVVALRQTIREEDKNGRIVSSFVLTVSL